MKKIDAGYNKAKTIEDLNEALKEIEDRENAFKSAVDATPNAEWTENKETVHHYRHGKKIEGVRRTFTAKSGNFEMIISAISAGFWGYKLKINGEIINEGGRARGWNPLMELWGDLYREFA